MKKLHIGLAIGIYSLLFLGVFSSALYIRSNRSKTPVDMKLISKEGAMPRIRISQSIKHDSKTPASPEALDIQDGETALELIKRTHPTETKVYSFGTLVEAIDGVKNGKDNKYWILYINSTQSKIGAGEYVIKKNDILEWRFEAYEQQ